MGIIGFKPTYGLLSRHGVIPYANSLDTVGILGRWFADVFYTFDHLNVPDPKDPTCLTSQARVRLRDARRERVGSNTLKVPESRHSGPSDTGSDQNPHRKNLHAARYQRRVHRIGVPLEYNIAELHPSVRTAWVRTLSHIQSNGHEIVPINLPMTKHALSAYYILAPAEASSNLAKYDGVRYGARASSTPYDQPAQSPLFSATRLAGLGPEARRRILLGTFTLSAGAHANYFTRAQRIRRLVSDEFNSIFRLRNGLRPRGAYTVPANGVDFVVVPTAAAPPPRLRDVVVVVSGGPSSSSSSSSMSSSPLDAYVGDVFTAPASLAGLPCVSVPGPPPMDPVPQLVDEMVGMQVIGQVGDDYRVLQFAHAHVNFQWEWEEKRRRAPPQRNWHLGSEGRLIR